MAHLFHSIPLGHSIGSGLGFGATVKSRLVGTGHFLGWTHVRSFSLHIVPVGHSHPTRHTMMQIWGSGCSQVFGQLLPQSFQTMPLFRHSSTGSSQRSGWMHFLWLSLQTVPLGHWHPFRHFFVHTGLGSLQVLLQPPQSFHSMVGKHLDVASVNGEVLEIPSLFFASLASPSSAASSASLCFFSSCFSKSCIIMNIFIISCCCSLPMVTAAGAGLSGMIGSEVIFLFFPAGFFGFPEAFLGSLAACCSRSLFLATWPPSMSVYGHAVAQASSTAATNASKVKRPNDIVVTE